MVCTPVHSDVSIHFMRACLDLQKECILNKTKIGKNCIIGANALVTENKVIPERSLVLGSPGKVVRQVTDEEIEHIKENARDYVENFKKYKK